MRWSLALLMLWLCTVPGALALDVSAVPALGGHVRPGGFSEVVVTVTAEQAGQVELGLSDGIVTHRLSVELNVAEPLVWRPVVQVNRDDPVLTVRLNGAEVYEEAVTFNRYIASLPLIAVVGTSTRQLSELPTTLQTLTIDDLPFNGTVYRSLAILIVDASSLAQLSEGQISGIQRFARQCGRIVLPGLSGPTLTRLSSTAGCGGRFLHGSEPGQLVKVVAGQLEKQAPSLPSNRNLSRLPDSEIRDNQIRNLIAFLALYFGALCATLFSRVALPYLLATYSVALLVGSLTWLMRDQEVERIVWSERAAGEALSRQRVLYRLHGESGRALVRFPLAAAPLQTERPGYDINYANASIEITVPSTLFSHTDFFGESDAVFRSPRISEKQRESKLDLTLDGNRPWIINNGLARSDPGILAWNDERYTVPSLAVGERWQPGDTAEPWGNSQFEQLFRRRAFNSEASLLTHGPGDDKYLTHYSVVFQ